MLTKIFLVISLFSLCFYLYGVLITISVSEKNVCNMTYMFEYPQYVVSLLIFNICCKNKIRFNSQLNHHITSVVLGHVIIREND